MRLADAPTTEISIDIPAPPDAVWPLLIDINLPARFSTEFQGADWIDPHPQLGARFVGRNEHPRIGRWESTSTVIEFEPNRRFAWAVNSVDNPAAVWTFELDPTETGCRLTYRMQLGPGPSGLSGAIDRQPEREPEIIERRIEAQLAQMRRVLEGIRDLAAT